MSSCHRSHESLPAMPKRSLLSGVLSKIPIVQHVPDNCRCSLIRIRQSFFLVSLYLACFNSTDRNLFGFGNGLSLVLFLQDL